MALYSALHSLANHWNVIITTCKDLGHILNRVEFVETGRDLNELMACECVVWPIIWPSTWDGECRWPTCWQHCSAIPEWQNLTRQNSIWMDKTFCTVIWRSAKLCQKKRKKASSAKGASALPTAKMVETVHQNYGDLSCSKTLKRGSSSLT